MCLRCGVVEYPYRSWPSGPAGPGDYALPPDASPPEYGAAPTGGLFGDWRQGRDYRWPRAAGTAAAPSAATSSPGCASSANQPRRPGAFPAPSRSAVVPGRPRAVARPSEVDDPTCRSTAVWPAAAQLAVGEHHIYDIWPAALWEHEAASSSPPACVAHTARPTADAGIRTLVGPAGSLRARLRALAWRLEPSTGEGAGLELASARGRKPPP